MRRQVEPVSYIYQESTERGPVTGSPELMAEAFRAGEGLLKRADGEAVRLSLIGYTAGADTVHFQLERDMRGMTTNVSPYTGYAAPKRAPSGQ